MPHNHQKIVEGIYNEIGKLDFGSLLIVNAALAEHIHRCWQNHQLQIEKAREANNGKPPN